MRPGRALLNKVYPLTAAQLTTKLLAVSDITRLTKQYGTALLLCPVLWALFIASNGSPPAELLAVFILGSFLMRSAGCVINDIADRDFDRHVERTRSRPLADGRLKVSEALALFITLSLLAFMLVLLLNTLTIVLSIIAIALASTYPLVKRISHFPQLFLGAAFGWGAVMAWTAVTGSLGPVALLIFIANVFWSAAYDTIYALMDREDDRKIGVKSTAIFFGDRVYQAIYGFYACMGLVLAAVGWTGGLGAVYYSGLGAVMVFFFMIVARIKRDPSRQGAMKGFVANVGGGVGIVLAIILDLNLAG